MPVAKSAQDRMIEYFVGAELAEATQTLRTAGVILKARRARVADLGPAAGGAKKRGRPKKAVVAPAVEGTAKKRGRPRKSTMPTGAMPPLGGVTEGV